jgi:putative transposase
MSVASFVASQRTDHGVPHARCCRWLGVSESWFYKWHDRAPTARQRRRGELDAAVRASFDDSGGTPGTYASPRVWEDLLEAGWRVSKKTAAASMVRQGLAGRSPKRTRRSLTRPDQAAAPIPDLVRRDFSAETLDQRWCGDLTEIPADEGKLYLATVEDLASRRLPGFAMSEHHDATLAKAALCMAATVRGGDVNGVIFHSDKGRRVHRRSVRAGVQHAGGDPVDGPGRAPHSTTRPPRVSTRPSSTSCSHGSASPPKTRPAARSPGSSTRTTTGAGTAAAR